MNNKKILNILVIGTGMYVCGRDTEEYGTIMPAICEWRKRGVPGNVFLLGRSLEGLKVAKAKILKLQEKMGVVIDVEYLHTANKDRQHYCSYKEVLENIPKPACAIVAVPDNLHKEITEQVLKQGLHALVVKPLVPTIKEAEELISAQERNRVYCAVEFHKRLDYANLKLRDVIAQGLIGDPLYFMVEYSQRKSMPQERFKKWVETTNVFQYLGVHYVDIIYFATKAAPKRVMAIGQKGWLVSKGINAYDSIQGVIEWEMPSGKKFTSHILTNWIDPEKTSAMSDQKIKVIGTKGRFESDQKRRGITIVTDEKGIEEPNPYFCSPYGEKGNVSYSGYGIDSICQFLDDVVQIEKGVLKIDDLEDKRPTFKQSLVPTAVLEGLNKSLRNNGEWVAIRRV